MSLIIEFSPIVMKTCFSERKMMKQFGNLALLREPYLSTNSLYL